VGNWQYRAPARRRLTLQPQSFQGFVVTTQVPLPETRHRWLPLFLLGVGLGAFVDGIVLHQILQWHHMLTDVERYPAETIAGIEANTLADGLFHAVAWIVVAVAVAMLLRQRRTSFDRRAVFGWLLVGWGAFNLVEGVVDHHLLGVHHVRDDVADPLPWDLAFLGVSALLVGGGAVLVHSAVRVPRIRRQP
jgi:uncharacterized membrane protein